MTAWGNDADQYYGYDDWNYGHGDRNHVGHVVMLLEQGTNTKKQEKHQEEPNATMIAIAITHIDIVTDSYDPLRSTTRAKPISIRNQYSLLTDDDSDSDNDDDDDSRRRSGLRSSCARASAWPDQ